MTRPWLIGTFALAFVGAVAAVACVSDLSNAGGSGDDGGNSADGGGTGADGNEPTQGSDGSTKGSDSGVTGCVDTCTDSTTLRHCLSDGGTASSQCSFDCSVDASAHCLEFVPSAPVNAADTVLTGLGDIVISADGFLSADDGTIDNIRPANPAPSTADTQGGVRYHVSDGVGIFTMKSLTINAGVTLKPRGVAAIAIVADSITINGTLDIRGYDANGVLCKGNTAGPGGFMGGNGTNAGQGPGGGAVSPSNMSGYDAGGAGGGGYGGDGGSGGLGNANLNAGSIGGPSYPFQTPIVGGSGGGSNVFGDVFGGGGGGAIQLVGLTVVTIGDPANTVSGINAGGCGGNSGNSGASGAGGGAGGTIFIESPTITLRNQGAIACNGGGGGTGNSGPQGSPGTMSLTEALGAFGVSGYGSGGTGGTGGATPGTFLSGGAGSRASNIGEAGGAGGGSVGRIALKNSEGALSKAANVIISPELTTSATTVTKIGLK